MHSKRDIYNWAVQQNTTGMQITHSRYCFLTNLKTIQAVLININYKSKFLWVQWSCNLGRKSSKRGVPFYGSPGIMVKTNDFQNFSLYFLKFSFDVHLFINGLSDVNILFKTKTTISNLTIVYFQRVQTQAPSLIDINIV